MLADVDLCAAALKRLDFGTRLSQDWTGPFMGTIRQAVRNKHTISNKLQSIQRLLTPCSPTMLGI